MDKQNRQEMRKMKAGIAAIFLLIFGLCITTYALITYKIRVEDNYFRMGNVEINLNDGKPVIEEHEFLFEPGMTVRKEFFVENESSGEIYYKLYFDNVEGGLSDVLDITIQDQDQVIASGKAQDLVRNKVNAAPESLKAGEKRTLMISFYFPKEKGNEAQDQTLSFNFSADAVQTKNNPDKLFE